MAKIKHDAVTGTYKLKINTAQMQLIAKLLAHVVPGINGYELAAQQLMNAIEKSECSQMLDSDDIEIVATREDGATREIVIMIPGENLTLRAHNVNSFSEYE